jgi:hypothetical protein
MGCSMGCPEWCVAVITMPSQSLPTPPTLWHTMWPGCMPLHLPREYAPHSLEPVLSRFPPLHGLLPLQMRVLMIMVFILVVGLACRIRLAERAGHGTLRSVSLALPLMSGCVAPRWFVGAGRSARLTVVPFYMERGTLSRTARARSAGSLPRSKTSSTYRSDSATRLSQVRESTESKSLGAQ